MGGIIKKLKKTRYLVILFIVIIILLFWFFYIRAYQIKKKCKEETLWMYPPMFQVFTSEDTDKYNKCLQENGLITIEYIINNMGR